MTVWIVLAETEELGNGVQAVFDNPESAEKFREIREKFHISQNFTKFTKFTNFAKFHVVEHTKCSVYVGYMCTYCKTTHMSDVIFFAAECLEESDIFFCATEC